MTTTAPEAVQPLQLVNDGKARINVVTVIHDTADILIVEIDMHSKYTEPALIHELDRPSELILMTEDRAMNINDCLNETVLRLPDHTSGWNVMADGGRYTIRVVAWKRDVNGR